jgi:antirestriction protein ArdC
MRSVMRVRNLCTATGSAIQHGQSRAFYRIQLAVAHS